MTDEDKKPTVAAPTKADAKAEAKAEAKPTLYASVYGRMVDMDTGDVYGNGPVIVKEPSVWLKRQVAAGKIKKVDL